MANQINTSSTKPIYSSALTDWLNRQKESQASFAEAKGSLREIAGMFAKGGSYGTGQLATIGEEARKAKSVAQLQGVQSGMSSGSQSVGTLARLAKDTSIAKMGVEDTRINALSQALSNLAGMQGTQAQVQASTYDPFANTQIGAQSAFETTQIGARASELRTLLNYQLGRSQLDFQQERYEDEQIAAEEAIYRGRGEARKQASYQQEKLAAIRALSLRK